MIRSKAKAAILALAAAISGVPQLAPLPAENTVKQAPAGTEKQAPAAPSQSSQQLQFLADLGAPIRRRARTGFYWPGRRAAAALRTAGKTRRMR